MEHHRYILWEKEIPYRLPEIEFVPSITEYRIHGCENAVLVCPGGGYKFKAEHEGPVIAEMINRAGISAFVLDYRVYPCKHQAPMNDALRAIRLIRSMGYQKVAILGFSAGGNVACCAATKYMDALLFSDDPVDKFDSRPDGLISCYSVVSMLERTHE
ncbi:MAG: alpha/beta hydrolase, partial [Clostridiales bacterium]|nr:alpha/beta hydrolase [Clostridiales bacterium]